MSLAQRISAESSRHTALREELASLDYVPSALRQADQHVTDVEKQVREATQRIEEAELARIEVWRANHGMQDSHVRKFMATMVGRGEQWREKASKEERQYLDAIDKVADAKRNREEVENSLKKAKQNAEELRERSTRREVLQQELQSLYSSIFDGPTPEAPEDDKLESALHLADRENAREQGNFIQEKRTYELLRDAHGLLEQLVQKMMEARGYSAGLGTRAEAMLEIQKVNEAKTIQFQYDTLIAEVRRVQPDIGALPTFEIHTQSTADIFFHNVFVDVTQHQEIKKGLKAAQAARDAVLAEGMRVKQRMDAAEQRARTTAEALNRARIALRDYRRQMFEPGPAPSYEEAVAESHDTVSANPA